MPSVGKHSSGEKSVDSVAVFSQGRVVVSEQLRPKSDSLAVLGLKLGTF